MLILDRKQDQAIVIETPLGRVTVRVVQILGGKTQSRRVKLGFVADKSIPIVRSELVKDGRAA